MKLRFRALSFLINFLLGVAWAFAFIGALSAFFTYQNFGIVAVVTHILIWAIPGLFLVIVLEYFLAGFQCNEELKKQSRTLERILESLKHPPIS